MSQTANEVPAPAFPEPSQETFYANLVINLDCVRELVSELVAVCGVRDEKSERRQEAHNLCKSMLRYLLHFKTMRVLNEYGKRCAEYFSMFHLFAAAKRFVQTEAFDAEQARRMLIALHGFVASKQHMENNAAAWFQSVSVSPTNPSPMT
jgi:hypothetical protein